MIKTSFFVLKNMYRFARRQTFLFIELTLLSSIIAPLLLLFNERMIANIMAFLNYKVENFSLVFWIGVIILVEILARIVEWMKSRTSSLLKKKLYYSYSEKLLEQFTNIEFACFESPKTRDIIQRVGEKPQEMLLSYFTTLISLISGVVAGIGYVVVFFSLSFFFGLVTIGVMAVLLVFNYKRVMMMARLYDEQTEDERRLFYYEDILSDKRSLIDLKVSGGTDFIIEKHSHLMQRILKDRMKRTVRSQCMYGAGYLSMVVWIGVVVAYIVVEIHSGHMTYSMAVALIAAMQSIYACFDKISEDFAMVSRSKVKIGYLQRFLVLPRVSQEKRSFTAIHSGPVEIEFEHVSFQYPDTKRDVLHNISFVLAPGEKVALVGANGSGKTTIIKLLCGLYTPTNGQIRVGGKELERIDAQALAKIFAVVFQDYAMYQFTVRENVTLTDVLRSQQEDEVEQAMYEGLAEDMIGQMDRLVGNLDGDGINLSGGQWQRLALARACFKKSSLLILDEPTSAMDPVAEDEMYREFVRLMKGRSCIFVSHRLAVAKHCDRILVLDGGQIVQQGTHNELMEQEGLYREMFERQSKWYLKVDDSRNTDLL